MLDLHAQAPPGGAAGHSCAVNSHVAAASPSIASVDATSCFTCTASRVLPLMSRLVPPPFPSRDHEMINRGTPASSSVYAAPCAQKMVPDVRTARLRQGCVAPWLCAAARMAD